MAHFSRLLVHPLALSACLGHQPDRTLVPQSIPVARRNGQLDHCWGGTLAPVIKRTAIRRNFLKITDMPAFGGAFRLSCSDNGDCRLEVRNLFPETVIAALPGRALTQLVDAPDFGYSDLRQALDYATIDRAFSDPSWCRGRSVFYIKPMPLLPYLPA